MLLSFLYVRIAAVIKSARSCHLYGFNQPARHRQKKKSDVHSTEVEQLAEVNKALETLQNFVEKNFEDVGTDLAKESLKIHYGVSESRNIRGVTTAAEEKELQKEGIELLKIPMPVKNKDAN